MRAQTLTIIGLERLGASIGLAIKAANAGLTIIGHDRSRDLAQEAKDKVGAIDRVELNLFSAAAAADILVLAVPLTELEAVLPAIGADVQPHALVLDLSALKGMGLRWAERYLTAGHYVGARPVLAAAYLNDGRFDTAAATPDLFKNSVFCLMPSAKADPAAVETAVAFGRLLGAVPYFVDPFEYDSLAQGLETLPGLAGVALFNAVQNATGWRDMLRFANASFAQATQPLQNGTDLTRLALNDQAATLRWLDALMAELATLRRLVQEGDRELIDLTLGNVLLHHERWLQERRENNWVEGVEQSFERPSASDALLGGWLSGKLKKDDKRES
jgi:prephenate dehydrogenase